MEVVAMQTHSYYHAKRGWELKHRMVLKTSGHLGVKIEPLGSWCKTREAAAASAKAKAGKAKE